MNFYFCLHLSFTSLHHFVLMLFVAVSGQGGRGLCHSLKELPLTSFEKGFFVKIFLHVLHRLIKISVLYKVLCVKLITLIRGRENCKR